MSEWGKIDLPGLDPEPVKRPDPKRGAALWTRAEFEALPFREGWNIAERFDSIIILPAKDGEELHDSGFRKMDFVGCRKGVPICRLSGCSDAIHFEGIGGRGKFINLGNGWAGPEATGWTIDCLPTSGLLQIFGDFAIEADSALSSFSIYSIKREKKR